MLKGYLCFVVSIFCIGVVTAVIGDIASHFGATLGIRDAVTAIIFVALGTSIPGECIFKELDVFNHITYSNISDVVSVYILLYEGQHSTSVKGHIAFCLISLRENNLK